MIDLGYLNGNGHVLNTLRRPFLAFFLENFRKPDEMGLNRCLMFQNMLNVTVAALAIQNSREHPNQVNQTAAGTFVEDFISIHCVSYFFNMAGFIYVTANWVRRPTHPSNERKRIISAKRRSTRKL